MMRAFAVLTTGAIALFALPVTAGATSRSAADASSAAGAVDGTLTTPHASGLEGFLTRPALLGLSTGAALWLSMAPVALFVAAVAIRRAKSLVSVTAPAAAHQLISDWSNAHHAISGLPSQRTSLRNDVLEHPSIAAPAAR